MKIEKDNSREIRWVNVLFIILHLTVFAMYGEVKTRGGAIVGVICAAVILLIISLALATLKVLVRNLDAYNLREKFPLAVRDFLRKNPDFRGSLAVWLMAVTVTLLWIDLPISLFKGNLEFTVWKTLLIMFLLMIIFFLISTRFPNKSGRIVPFDEVKILLASEEFHDIWNHFEKARKFFDEQPKPDNENCIKEAACALEACLEIVTKKPASKDFIKVVKQLEGKEPGKIPSPIADGMIKLYAYRGDGKAIAHAALHGSRVSDNEAELILNQVASYIVYLCALYSPGKKNDEA